MNNLVENNLITTVYWVGTGQDALISQFSSNNDAAIMARDAISVRLLVCINNFTIYHFDFTSCLFLLRQNNLIAGVERLAYRIPGESCGGSDIYIPLNVMNEYSNNEAHSAMSGVSLWPTDKGFIYDRSRSSEFHSSSHIVSFSLTILECVLIKGFK
jgi:hypothetical protein